MRIEGRIAQGKQLGRTIGFPTANLQPAGAVNLQLKGVYAAWFELEGERLPCMVNIGHHPTLPEGAPTIEAHIFDYSVDLYGKRAAVELVTLLRPEQTFPSVEALRLQLERDKVRSMEILYPERKA